MFADFISSMPSAINLALIWSIAGIGVFLTYKILDIPDLTVDGSFTTGAFVCAMVINNGGHFALGMLLGFVAGLLCGLITGLLHTLIGIPPILSGILTQIALWSVNFLISNNKSSLSLSSYNFDTLLALNNVYDALWKLAIIVAVVIGLLYLFFGTQLGSSIRATGSNQKMAKAHGINTKLNIVITLAISNGLVALSGTLLAQYQGTAEVNMGRGAIVICLCAVVVGGLIFNKLAKNFAVKLSSVIIGAFIYFVIYQILYNLELDTYIIKLLSAVMVIIFIGIPYIQRTYFGRVVRWRTNRKIKNSKEGE